MRNGEAVFLEKQSIPPGPSRAEREQATRAARALIADPPQKLAVPSQPGGLQTESTGGAGIVVGLAFAGENPAAVEIARGVRLHQDNQREEPSADPIHWRGIRRGCRLALRRSRIQRAKKSLDEPPTLVVTAVLD